MQLHSRWILCVLVFFIAGCSQVTHFEGHVAGNPLQQIAEQAAPEFKATWVDDNTLLLRDLWPIHSIFSIGYTTFNADLQYTSGQLQGDFYLQSNQILNLLIPRWRTCVIRNATPWPETLQLTLWRDSGPRRSARPHRRSPVRSLS